MGNVDESFATGNVTGTGVAGLDNDGDAGGLVAYAGGSIKNSFSSGNVTGVGNVYHYDANEDKWNKVSGEVTDGKISIKVKHFSIYGVFVAQSTDSKNQLSLKI